MENEHLWHKINRNQNCFGDRNKTQKAIAWKLPNLGGGTVLKFLLGNHLYMAHFQGMCEQVQMFRKIFN